LPDTRREMVPKGKAVVPISPASHREQMRIDPIYLNLRIFTWLA
jgi:hypothetical protein